jgi:hypothetical protein
MENVPEEQPGRVRGKQPHRRRSKYVTANGEGVSISSIAPLGHIQDGI